MPTSFTFTDMPEFQSESFIIRVDVVPGRNMPCAFYCADAPGRTDVEDLTYLADRTLNADGDANIWANEDWDNTEGMLWPIGVRYYYIQLTGPGGVLGSVIGNETPITIRVFEAPTAFTYSVIGDFIILSRQTGSSVQMGFILYYGAPGATSAVGLELIGPGAWGRGGETYLQLRTDLTQNGPLPISTVLYVLAQLGSLPPVLIRNDTPLTLGPLPANTKITGPNGPPPDHVNLLGAND
jgi:hypothetical protein